MVIAFLKIRQAATDQIDHELEASAATVKAVRQSRDRHALSSLNNLIEDAQFTRLPTQKAMLAYAVEKIPELEAVDPDALKMAIQNLRAKITAKGLDRKR